MSDLRPFRFGVYASGISPGQHWADLARAVEDRGYATLVMPDHLDGQLSPIPALATAAAVTSTLRIGTFVLSNELRHPLLVAHDAATLDILSGGRFELGLGAGWRRATFDRLGVAFDHAGDRVRRLAEAATIVRGALDDPEFSFAGAHYQVNPDPDRPMPVQRRVPILVGGGGPQVLSLAARQADIVGVNPDLRSGDIPDFAADVKGTVTDAQLSWVRKAAGGRYPGLEINVLLLTVHIGDMGMTPPNASPHVLVGTVDSAVDLLLERRERWGISYVVVPIPAMAAFAPVVERLTGR
jgi:probable F420-dependent oxidoreductase